MRVTIIKDDGVVGVDGVFRAIDLSELDPTIHAVQWNGSIGYIEFNDGKPPISFGSIANYQSFIDLWTAAAPPPPTLDELKKEKIGAFRTEAIVRMAAQVSAWDNFETIKVILSIANMLNTAAMTPAQTLAKDILIYARDTVPPKVDAVLNQNDLSVIDPTAADPFGDGTLWPT